MGPTDCQPWAYKSLAPLKPSASADVTALEALLINVEPLRLHLHRSLRLRPTARLSWPRYSIAFSLNGPNLSAAIGFDRLHGPCTSDCLPATQPSGRTDTMARVAPASCQLSAYTALAALQPSISPLIVSIQPIEPCLKRKSRLRSTTHGTLCPPEVVNLRAPLCS